MSSRSRRQQLATGARWLVPVLALLGSTTQTLAQQKIGESHVVQGKETPHPYAPAAVKGDIIWSDFVRHEGATFIKVWFTDFSLAENDYVIVRDPLSIQVHRYDVSIGAETFWLASIFADHVIIELHSESDVGGRGFRIGGYAEGNIPLASGISCSPNDLCGVDEECINGTPPYPLRTPVCAIIYVDCPDQDPDHTEYVYMCSGYQIADSRVMTNFHCTPTPGQGCAGGWVGNAECWFNAELMRCGSGAIKPIDQYMVNALVCCSDCKPGETGAPCGTCPYAGPGTDPQLDYALLAIKPIGNAPPSLATYGQLPLRKHPPEAGEFVYHHQHSKGCQKQYTDGVIVGKDPFNPNYVRYDTLTAGGSSGSPVISAVDECVIVHHGYGWREDNDPNRCTLSKGSEMSAVIADLKAQACLPPDVILCNFPPPPPPHGDLVYDNWRPLDDEGHPRSQKAVDVPFWAETADDFILIDPFDPLGLNDYELDEIRFGAVGVAPTRWDAVKVTIYLDAQKCVPPLGKHPAGEPVQTGSRGHIAYCSGGVICELKIPMTKVYHAPLNLNCSGPRVYDIRLFNLKQFNCKLPKNQKMWIAISPEVPDAIGQTFLVLSNNNFDHPAMQFFPPPAAWVKIPGNAGICPGAPPAGTRQDIALEIWVNKQPCIKDRTINIPFCDTPPIKQLGDTTGAGNDSSLRPSEDLIVSFNIGEMGSYSFDLTTNVPDPCIWDSYMYLIDATGDPCAGTGVIAFNDDCSGIGCFGLSCIGPIKLQPGEYWIVIEGFGEFDAGPVDLHITSGCPPSGANLYTDPAEFEAALLATDKRAKASWNFKPNDVPLGTGGALDDPVNINGHTGAGGAFDPWTDPAGNNLWPPSVDNVTFQSNIDGPQPPLPNPRGIDGLFFANAMFDYDNNILVANIDVDSFDILSGPPAGDNHTAMSIEIVAAGSGPPPGPVLVTVYDKFENPVGKLMVDIFQNPPPPAGVAGGRDVAKGEVARGGSAARKATMGKGARGEPTTVRPVVMGEALTDRAGTGTGGVAGRPPPPNDNCVARIFIEQGVATDFDTTLATTDGPPAPAGCTGGGGPVNDIWFNWDSGFTGEVDITTCEELGGFATFDTVIVVYDGCSCAPLPPVLGCNDDDLNNACGTGGGGFHSTVNVPVVAGNCYKIQVGGFSGTAGGPGSLLIAKRPEGGACCLDDTTCVDVADVAACDALGGTFQGGGTDCATVNCPPPPAPIKKAFLGIIMKPPLTIGRVNLYDLGGGAEGISKITVYADSPGILNTDISGPLGAGFPDGCVDAFDLGTLLGAWCSSAGDPDPPGDIDPPCEGCTSPNAVLADLSGPEGAPDGCVDAFDLAKLLANWCSVAGGNPCGTCFP